MNLIPSLTSASFSISNMSLSSWIPLCRFLLQDIFWLLDNDKESNFRDTVNPMCPTNDGIDDMEHFLLLCPSFDIQRQDLLAPFSELLRPCVQIETLPNNVLVQYLLYGNKELSNDVTRNVLEHTLNFIHKTGRFG